jgi:hypothetical protein
VSVCDSHQHHHQQTPVRSGRVVRPALPRPRVNFAWTHAIGQPSPLVIMFHYCNIRLFFVGLSYKFPVVI